MGMAENPNPGKILIAENHYIAQTVFQANEDRARVASFYMPCCNFICTGRY
jgi:hypothetical protein